MSNYTKEAKSSKAKAKAKAKTKTKTDTDLSANNVSDSQRQHYIEIAAYHIAEKDGFNSGCDMENWLAAEAEIDLLMAGLKNTSRN